jgi:hypothetical protein
MAAAVAGTAGDAKAICELKQQLTRLHESYTRVLLWKQNSIEFKQARLVKFTHE